MWRKQGDILVEKLCDRCGQDVITMKLSETCPLCGGRLMKRLEMGPVDCPILGEQVSFTQCFDCRNFVRRVNGKVECLGYPL